jgi:SRSO17 transposase
MAPFVDVFKGQAPKTHALTYVQGLLSDVERKHIESIAYHFAQERLGLQGFIGWGEWEEGGLQQELLSQVGKDLGQRDGTSRLVSSSPEDLRRAVFVSRAFQYVDSGFREPAARV